MASSGMLICLIILINSLGMLRSALTRRFSSIGSFHHVPKFYKQAIVEKMPSDDLENGHTVKLDQRTLKSAEGRKYVVPNGLLAHLVALEFLAQKDYIVGATMPLVDAGLTSSALPSAQLTSCTAIY